MYHAEDNNCHDKHKFPGFFIMNYLSTGIAVMYCLLEVVSVCPEKLAPRFVDKIDWIKVSIVSYLYLNVRWCEPHRDIYCAIIS